MLFDSRVAPQSHPQASVWTASRGIDPFLFLLLAYPLLLLAISSNWIFSPAGYIDPWVYYGYFQDLVALKNDPLVSAHYYGSRLSWLLPGFLAHRFLAPEAASAVLHLAVYYLAVFSLYFTLRLTVGQRGALVGALLLGGYGFFLNAAGWDYVDGAGIAYCLLAMALLTRAASSSPARAARLTAAAGAAGAAMVHANLLWLTLCPLFAIYCWRLPRRHDGGPEAAPHRPPERAVFVQALAWFVTGGAALTALLCIVNYWICGTWLFFLPSVRFAMQSAAAANPWAEGAAQWIPRASWLALPGAAFAAFAGAWFVARKRRRALTPVDVFGLLFAAACLLLLALEWAGAPVLQLPYYASYLLPWLFLALGAALSPLLEALSATAFTAVLLVCGVAFPLPLWGTGTGAQLTARFGSWLPLALAALLIPALLPRTRSRGALALALFALCASHATLAPFAYGSSERHAARQTFQRLAAAAQAVREATSAADFKFWYDRQEQGFPEFLSLNSIFIWGHRTLGMNFPALPKNIELQPGTILVIPSERADVAGQANTQLRAQGLEAVAARSEPITLPGVSYRIHFLKVVSGQAHTDSQPRFDSPSHAASL